MTDWIKIKPPCELEMRGKVVQKFIAVKKKRENDKMAYVIKPRTFMSAMGFGRGITISCFEDELVEEIRIANSDGSQKKNNLKIIINKDLEGNVYKVPDVTTQSLIRERDTAKELLNHHRDRADRSEARNVIMKNEPLQDEKAQKIVKQKMEFYGSFDKGNTGGRR